MSAFTKDKVEVIIDGYLTVKVIDSKKAVYGVARCIKAIRWFAQSSCRTAIGKMELQELLDNRSAVSNKVLEDVSDELKEWGFSISRFEIQDLTPKNTYIADALKNQINAEQTSKKMQIDADS